MPRLPLLRLPQDDFALQTIAENGKVGFVTTNQANGGLYCDVLPDSEEAHPKRPLCARFTLVGLRSLLRLAPIEV
jgi:hypothetical protein